MKKRTIVVIIFFLCFGIASLVLTAQAAKETTDQDAKLAKVFFETNRLDRPGCAVLVLKEGKVVLKKGFGLASMEVKNPITPTTMFDATAMARPITAMAVLMLAQKSKLSLEDDIRKHLPELPEYKKPVRIRHLLYHSSGIWDWTKILPAAGWRLSDVITMAHIMNVLEKQKVPAFEPGSKYLFSHSNYTLLAEIVARTSERSYREWTWRNIFRPLKMRNSMFRDRHGEPVENQAIAYIYNRMRGYFRDSGNLDAVGSHNFYTNVEDLAKWTLNLESAALGGKNVIEKLLTHGVLDNGKKMKHTAAGFSVDQYKGLKRFSAEGLWSGFNASFQHFPNAKYTVILLTNWQSGWNQPAYTSREITNIFLADRIKQKQKEAAAKKAALAKKKVETTKKPANVTVKTEILDGYVGDYRWDSGGHAYILRQKEQLQIRFSKRGRPYPMSAISDTKFKLMAAPYFFTFKTDKAGQITCKLVTEGQEPEMMTKFVRVKLNKEQLKEYEGTFYCKALDTRYVVAVQDKGLTVSHMRLNKVTLTPEVKDKFAANSRAYSIVDFLRDKQQKITGLKLEGISLKFEKI